MPASAPVSGRRSPRDVLLSSFPARVHALTLVSDADDLLADEDLLGTLADRGFAVVMEEDPILLRVRVEQARPWTPERPLVVVTRGDLRNLPYDLWQAAHRVRLSLNEFFPLLSYPIVRSLTPLQRLRLAGAPDPPTRLGERSSIEFVLRYAFQVDPVSLAEPVMLASWLNPHHARREVLPETLRTYLISQLASVPALAELDLTALLTDASAFAQLIRQQWSGYLRRSAGKSIAEAGVPYLLPFERDHDLQDQVTGFVRTGMLDPVAVAEPGTLPVWARPAVIAATDDSREQRAKLLVDWLRERLEGVHDDWRWSDWKEIARSWAELTVLRFDANPVRAFAAEIAGVERELDQSFLRWLRRRYASLGGQKLPEPHHVHHVPYWLATERQRSPGRRVALVVVDGMSLADWQVIAPVWQQRHPLWALEETLLLAQVPTVTAISRQALVSGRRPEQFASSIATNAKESRLWTEFWASQELNATDVAMERVTLEGDTVPVLPTHQIKALYWITNSVDDIVHGATLGTSDVLASLRLWLDQRSPMLERGIQELLADGFTVVVASDHGHVEAGGTGMLSEGMAVATKGKRARTYRDRLLAERAQGLTTDTLLWEPDGLLPDDLWTLLPSSRTAFATPGETVVTHGGATIDEVVVPLITIRMD